jgi:alginate O-acetyltransferase complex protein AlgI
MLFNSASFIIFFPIVFILYWFFTKGNLRIQNILLILASYFFYACWDWRFLFLLIFSTLLDYTTGIKIHNAANQAGRRFWLWLSIIINLGLLGVFKYYNFFIESFQEGLSLIGFTTEFKTLNVILPVGISFYTFHGLSYIIDIYKKRISPERNFVDYSLFVCFFPLLVAGPIERATHLLPQIVKKREFSFSQSREGIRLMLWGFFKKVVIADALAPSVNEIFQNYQTYNTPILILGAVFFAFQIYGDFSGYSDIARGTAKLFGIELMLNFNFPYFSRSIAEFWRKWHISLSTWFRDYLYIPLGGSKAGKLKSIRNVFIIFLVSGIWHGANWTFIAWAIIHALLFVPSFVSATNRNHLTDIKRTKYFVPSIPDFLQILRTFILVTIAWIFFRAESITHAVDFIGNIFSFNFTPQTFLNPYDNQVLFKEYFYLAAFILAEYCFVTNIVNFYSRKLLPGLIIDGFLLSIIIINSPLNSSISFIYFQF